MKLSITFKTFSKILNKYFVNTETFKTMADFNLYALALFHGQIEILEIKEIA